MSILSHHLLLMIAQPNLAVVGIGEGSVREHWPLIEDSTGWDPPDSG